MMSQHRSNSSSGVSSTCSQHASSVSSSNAATPSSYEEGDEDYYYNNTWSYTPSSSSSRSLSSRVLSNRATDNEFVATLTGNANPLNGNDSSQRTAVSKKKVALLSAGIVLVLLLFSLPIILRYCCLPKFYDCSSSQNHSCYLIPNRTEQGSCEFFSHKTQYSCTGVQLEESNICWQQLNGWQEQCAHSVDDSSVWVNETANEDFIDNVIEMFKSSNASSWWCSYHATQLLCRYAHPFCWNGSLYEPTRGYCDYVTEVACAAEIQWLSSNSSKYRFLGSLVSSFCKHLHSYPFENKCSRHFSSKSKNQYCLPSCVKFNQRTPAVYQIMKVLLLTSCISGMIAAVIIILSFAAQCRAISAVFPTIYLIFAHIGHFVICVLLLVSVVTDGKVNCSRKDNLIKSFINSTPYCKALGAFTQYIIVFSTYWITLYTSVITYKVLCPIHSKRTTKIQFFIYTLLLAAGWLFPLPSVVVALTKDKFRFVLMQFPPLFCASVNMDLWLYSVMIVINVFIAVEVCLLLVVFCAVHKYQGILLAQHKGQIRISVAEKKLLFSFCYYTVAGIIALVYFGFATASADGFMNAAFAVFDCEMVGFSSNSTRSHCEKQYDELERFSNNWLSLTTFLLLTMAPTVSLLFVFNGKKMKESISLCLHARELDTSARFFRSPTTRTYQTIPAGAN